MAKITIGSNSTSGFSEDAEVTVNGNDTKAVISYVDGAVVKFFGDNLEVRADGTFKAGTVDKVVMFNSDGDAFLTATGSFKAAKLAGDSFSGEGIYTALLKGGDVITGSGLDDNLTSGFGGDDVIKGRAGVDSIVGGADDDVLSGGADTDTFVFSADDGVQHDIITDFDILGGDADILSVSGMTFQGLTKAHGGVDTMMHFADGSTILFEDVKKADLQDYLSI